MNLLLVTKSMGKLRLYVNNYWPQNSGFQTDRFSTPQINGALCLNGFVPEIVGVGLELIVIYFPLKESLFGRIAAGLVSGKKPHLSSIIASPLPNFLLYTY